MTHKKENNKSITLTLPDSPLANNSLSSNISQEYIVITKDKVTIILQEFKTNLLSCRWESWLGMFLTFFIAILTADFKSFFCFSAEFVRSSFEVGSLVCLSFFIFSLCKRIKHRKEIEISYCIEMIKKQK